MSSHTFKLRQPLRRFWAEHGHFLAAMLCGLLFGAMFGTAIDVNRAEESPVTMTTQSIFHEQQQVVPRGEKIVERLQFTVEVTVYPEHFAIVQPVSTVIVDHARSSAEKTQESRPSKTAVVQNAHFSSVATAPRVVRPVRVPQLHTASVTERVAVQVSLSEESSSSLFSSTSSDTQQTSEDAGFPAFGRTLHPVARVPNWGAMKTPDEWNRTYSQMTEADFVPIPRYDMSVLTTPMSTLLKDREANVAAITAKLYYSTRYMGTYDLDAAEYAGAHPGVDLKLARGTLIGSVAGGRVYAIKSNDILGTYVVIEHRKDGEQFFSIYGHLDSATVSVGDNVKPGQGIGRVGMTGKTVSPHLHLEVNRGFLPDSLENVHGAAGSESGGVHPITFIVTGGNGG